MAVSVSDSDGRLVMSSVSSDGLVGLVMALSVSDGLVGSSDGLVG